MHGIGEKKMTTDEFFSEITTSGDFNNLDVFDFEGVYIIVRDDNEIVYIGSAYGRKIKTRLNQYLKATNTGNTLGRAIAKELSKSKSFDKKAEKRMEEAVEIIKTFKILAIEHHDLEYNLIKNTKPIYNTRGKSAD